MKTKILKVKVWLSQTKIEKTLSNAYLEKLAFLNGEGDLTSVISIKQYFKKKSNKK